MPSNADVGLSPKFDREGAGRFREKEKVRSAIAWEFGRLVDKQSSMEN